MTESPARRRLGVVAVVVTFAAVALAFALPWLPEGTPGGSELERYQPERDSASRLGVVRAASGRIEGWETVNRARIPALRAFAQLRIGFQDAIRAFYARGGEESVPFRERLQPRRLLEDVQIVQSRTNRLDPADPARLQPGLLSVLLRERRGLLLIGQYNEESGQELVIDPPAQLLPSDLRPGRRWSSRGKFGPVPYVLIGSAGPRGSYRGPLGTFDDCLTVDIRLTLGTGAKQADSHTMERRCAGVGVVESRVLDPAGRLVRRSVTIATDGRGTPAGAPPAVALPDRARLTDPGRWRLERIRTLDTGSPGSSTFAPVYLEGGDPPTVLAATNNGDLLALDAALTGTERWRFHAGGPILGPPAIDRRRGRIYFGAADKRLYALDARGLFLWSHRTGDNVASRPAVAGETVVFGSEDRSVYGLDGDTGARRWRVRTGGPVVSGPAVIGSTVAIGSDDGSVYGLDPRTGDERWRREVGGAVEAPIVGAAGVAYAVSRRGVVAALRPRDGTVRWTRDLEGTLRTAPALGGDVLLVVSEEGTLTALDRETGRERWSLRDRAFVGPPAVAGGGVIAASQDGLVRLLDFAGRERGRWSAGLASPGDVSPGRQGFLFGNPRPGFGFGPTLGGGAAWLGDEAVVLRLGPPGVSGGEGRPAGPARSTSPPRSPGR
ncbi:MAG: PQQ-binding-like beta-propeller repeat protein [Thermoleophilaceae bacterium]